MIADVADGVFDAYVRAFEASQSIRGLDMVEVSGEVCSKCETGRKITVSRDAVDRPERGRASHWKEVCSECRRAWSGIPAIVPISRKRAKEHKGRVTGREDRILRNLDRLRPLAALVEPVPGENVADVDEATPVAWAEHLTAWRAVIHPMVGLQAAPGHLVLRWGEDHPLTSRSAVESAVNFARDVVGRRVSHERRTAHV